MQHQRLLALAGFASLAFAGAFTAISPVGAQTAPSSNGTPAPQLSAAPNAGASYQKLQSTTQSTCLDLLRSAPEFTMLTRAIGAAGLTNTLNGAGPYTIFAPTDAAFARVSSDRLAAAMNDPQLLRAIVGYHVVKGILTSDRLRGREIGDVRALNGLPLTVAKTSAGAVTVNNANIIQADVTCTNGIIHVIDTVLTPARP